VQKKEQEKGSQLYVGQVIGCSFFAALLLVRFFEQAKK
jgi:hypothetical protein